MKNLLSSFLISTFVMLTAQAQIIKTSLTLTVRDELGNTVKDASVKLFENEADYTVEKNYSAEGTTDEKGVVKFKDLKAIPYFVLASKGDKDNVGAGEKTGKLSEKKFNKATIIIQ